VILEEPDATITTNDLKSLALDRLAEIPMENTSTATLLRTGSARELLDSGL
jgi:hypothetical protein